MLSEKKRESIGKVFLILISIILILFGIGKLLKGDLNYSNYWGGVVFAPIAIIIGIILIFVVLFSKNLIKNNQELDQKFKVKKNKNYKK
jgi:hypothetical protein